MNLEVQKPRGKQGWNIPTSLTLSLACLQGRPREMPAPQALECGLQCPTGTTSDPFPNTLTDSAKQRGVQS